MRRVYLITATLLVALALFIGIGALQLRYYTPLGPGPGFFAFWLSICLAAAALSMGVQAWRDERQELPAGFFPTPMGLAKMAAVGLGMIFVIALLEPLGFRLTMLSMVLFLLWALGQRNFIVTPLIALLGSFGVYQLFVHGLNVPLPIGLFGI